jgi:hypothetical protein
MAASTNHALAVRAVKNARTMDFWAKQLLAEAKKQNIDITADYLSGDETIVLPLVIVRNIFEGMRDMVRDIGSFEPPKAARSN